MSVLVQGWFSGCFFDQPSIAIMSLQKTWIKLINSYGLHLVGIQYVSMNFLKIKSFDGMDSMARHKSFWISLKISFISVSRMNESLVPLFFSSMQNMPKLHIYLDLC